MNSTKVSTRNLAAAPATRAEREHVASARTFMFTRAARRRTRRIGELQGPGQQSGTTRRRLPQRLTRWITIATAAFFCWHSVAGRPADHPYGMESRTPLRPFLNHRLPPDQPEPGKWLVAPAFPNLRFANPVGLVPEPGGNRLCVHQREGIIYDTRSDIYSLGVLLYELLTGSTPFETKELMQSGLDEMRRIIREREPMHPSTRLSQLAHASQAKILNNEPIVARPPSASYRFQKGGRPDPVTRVWRVLSPGCAIFSLDISPPCPD
jgi:hypothetical protein